MVLPDVYGFAGHENCWVRRQIDTGLAHVNYRNAIKCTLWQRLVRLLRDVWRENSKWELMRHRRLERVGNGKFPCGLCWKLKAVRGGVEVEGEAGKREGGTSGVGNFHYHPIHTLFRPPQTDNHGRNVLSDCRNSLRNDIRLEPHTDSQISTCNLHVTLTKGTNVRFSKKILSFCWNVSHHHQGS